MQEKRVPLAKSVRWRRIRSQALPVVALLLAIVCSGWLWQRTGGLVQAIGEVDSPRVEMTSPIGGQVVAIPPETRRPWVVYDHVQAGDVIARIHDPQSAADDPTTIIEVQAPISGTLVALHSWPGQTVIAGSPIATIAADHGQHIIGYIPENSTVVAAPGMLVTLRARAVGARRVKSEIEQVGHQVEEVPQHQTSSLTTPEWGTPVRIKMPNDLVLRPGTLVDIMLRRSN
jgi:multidrug resistance efflux pump